MGFHRFVCYRKDSYKNYESKHTIQRMRGFRNKYMLITYKLKEPVLATRVFLLDHLIGFTQIRKLVCYDTSILHYSGAAVHSLSLFVWTENGFTYC